MLEKKKIEKNEKKNEKWNKNHSFLWLENSKKKFFSLSQFLFSFMVTTVSGKVKRKERKKLKILKYCVLFSFFFIVAGNSCFQILNLITLHIVLQDVLVLKTWIWFHIHYISLGCLYVGGSFILNDFKSALNVLGTIKHFLPALTFNFLHVIYTYTHT